MTGGSGGRDGGRPTVSGASDGGGAGDGGEASAVARSFARDPDEQGAAYDAWAADYERELYGMGYRLPAALAAMSRATSPPARARSSMPAAAAARRASR